MPPALATPPRPRPAVILAAAGACLGVATMALLAGSVVTVEGTRVSPRVTREVIETRGVITAPVERVMREGRVDVVVRRRVLGLVPWRTRRLEDVTDVGAVSGSTTLRGSGGRGQRSYGTEALTVATRGGDEWRSDAASGLIGSDPGEGATSKFPGPVKHLPLRSGVAAGDDDTVVITPVVTARGEPHRAACNRHHGC